MLIVPSEICADNQGSMALATGNSTSDRTEHFRVKMKFVQEAVQKGRVSFKYVCSEENAADLFTKKLPGPRIVKLSDLIGLGYFFIFFSSYEASELLKLLRCFFFCC